MDKMENCLKLCLALRLLLALLLTGQSRVQGSCQYAWSSFGSVMYQISRGLLGACRKYQFLQGSF